MSLRIDDRWLWLGFSAFALLALGGIRYAVKDVIQLTKLERIEDENADSNREKPEDSISLEDLKILTESPNSNIANATTSLVLDRFLRQPDAYKSLMKDMKSRDEATRNRARRALEFLRNWPLMSDSSLPRYPLSRSNSGQSTSAWPSMTLEELGVHSPLREDDEVNRTMQAGLDVVIPSDDNPVAGWTNVPRERPAEDEVERRRRRREAMVLRESDGRVVESDIIRPNLNG